MHEFSIAQHIVDIALQTRKEYGIDKVTSVEVEIGEASGVVAEALEFAWESAIKDTDLQNSELVIKSIAVEVTCRSCKTQFNPGDLLDICPQCGDLYPEILKGRELRVSAIIG